MKSWFFIFSYQKLPKCLYESRCAFYDQTGLIRSTAIFRLWLKERTTLRLGNQVLMNAGLHELWLSLFCLGKFCLLEVCFISNNIKKLTWATTLCITRTMPLLIALLRLSSFISKFSYEVIKFIIKKMFNYLSHPTWWSAFIGNELLSRYRLNRTGGFCLLDIIIKARSNLQRQSIYYTKCIVIRIDFHKSLTSSYILLT